MDNNHESPIQSPTDMLGVGIHLSYLRRDLQTLNAKIDNIATAFATTADLKATDEKSIERYQENKSVLEDHENRLRRNTTFIENMQGKMWAIGTLISLLGTIAGIIVEHFVIK